MPVEHGIGESIVSGWLNLRNKTRATGVYPQLRQLRRGKAEVDKVIRVTKSGRALAHRSLPKRRPVLGLVRRDEILELTRRGSSQVDL